MTNNFDLQNQQRKRNGNFRTLVSSSDEEYPCDIQGSVCDFSSNDYLGLARDKQLYSSVFSSDIPFLSDTVDRFGSTGSRLLSGNHGLYSVLENCLSDLFDGRSILAFNSGYQANLGILSALVGREDVIFMDKLCHASLIDGARLSRAKVVRYRHNDYEHLRELLTKYRGIYKQSIIVSEGVFSMDGDQSSIPDLVALKTEFECLLYIDEAHSFGLYADQGQGLCFDSGHLNDVDIIVGTFGKAIGGYGAFVVCSESIKDFLINHARSFIYSTALPLPVIRWNILALKKMMGMSKERQLLLEMSQIYRSKLSQLGTVLGTVLGAGSLIIPLRLSYDQLLSFHQKLCDHHIHVPVIRYPTVPKAQERLRFSLTLDHSLEDLERVIDAVS